MKSIMTKSIMASRTAGLAAATALSMAAVTAASAETWDMPVAYPSSNFHTENDVAFGKCVTDATGGDISVVVHANGSLFAGNDIKRAVQTGQAPIGERLLSAHANENPLFGLDSIPFLATSFDASEKLWAAGLDAIKGALEEQNLVYLYAVPWPSQGLYVDKEVNDVADLKGVKFRAYNAATARIAELAGMAPVQIEAADLSQALATGVVESFISSGATGVDSKVWESLDHFYDVQAWLPRNVIFANKDAWDALDDKTREAVTTCADKAAETGLAKVKELAGGYLDTLKKNGMKVEPPSDELAKQFEGFGETMTQDWIKQAGDQGAAIIEAYRK